MGGIQGEKGFSEEIEMRAFRVIYRILSDDLEQNGEVSAVKDLHREIVSLYPNTPDPVFTEQDVVRIQSFLCERLDQIIHDPVARANMQEQVVVAINRPVVLEALYCLFKKDEVFINIAPYHGPTVPGTVGAW
ncbi:MAG: hypothetical protein QNJ97_22660 [Myxococcota bacterium]|nr:hypothetical protein [Myxococcota bacterium]